MKLEKMTKNLILDPTLADLTQFSAEYFFSWILPLLVLRHCCELSLYAISRVTKFEKMAKNLVLGTNLGSKSFFHGF